MRDSKGITSCKARCLWCKKIVEGKIYFENSLLVKLIKTVCKTCDIQEMVL